MAVYGAASFAVLQVVDLLVPILGLSDAVMRVLVVLLFVGFPAAVFFEWAFELGPEGIRRTEQATPGELTAIISASPYKRWLSGLLALVGMGALTAGSWYAGRQSASGDEVVEAPVVSPSIAVLPFANMSSDPDRDYFSDGVAEELLIILGRIPGLRVASRTSAFAFKGQDLDLPEIARRLNVGYILEGAVRFEGENVRITARLVDAPTDTRIWSETWDRTLGDVFAVQEEIASAVVDSLEITLMGARPRVAATDPEAYALFLQGRQLGRQRTAEALQDAVAVLKHAVTIDPAYAPVWGELARVYSTQVGSGLLPIDEGYELAREAADRALSIDPEYAPAIAHLGLIAMAHDNDLAAAAEYYERALALAPTDTDIMTDAAGLLQGLGRLDQAITLKEYAVARDPMNPRGHHNLGNAYRWAGRWDDAIASFNAALSLSPGHLGARAAIAQALLGKGEPGAALAAAQLEPSRPWLLIGSTMAYHALSRSAESDADLAELMEGWQGEAAYNIAYVLAFRGEADRAFDWLDRAVDYRDPGLSEILMENAFAGIRSDARWFALLERLGRAPAQLAEIEFNVTVPD